MSASEEDDVLASAAAAAPEVTTAIASAKIQADGDWICGEDE